MYCARQRAASARSTNNSVHEDGIDQKVSTFMITQSCNCLFMVSSSLERVSNEVSHLHGEIGPNGDGASDVFNVG